MTARRWWIPGVSIAGYAAAVAVARDGWQGALAAPVAAIPIARWLAGSANAWLTLFFVVALLAPPLPVAAGNAHPAIAIAAAGVAVGIIRLGEWRFERTFLAAALLIFFALLAISLAPATLESGPEIAGASLARLGLAAIALYVFFYVSAGPGRVASVSLPMVYGAAVAAAAFACIDFFYQLPAPAGAGPQFIWTDTDVFRRAQGLFYEASTLGNLCAFFVVMTAVALVKARWNRWALLAGGAVFAAALVFSYSRSSLVNVAVALAALLWMERKRPEVRRMAIAAGAALALTIAALSLLFPAYMGAFWVRLSGSFAYALSGDSVVLSGRIDSWKTLGEFLIGHPWHLILGVGYKTLPYSDFTGTRVVADNMYLSALVEAGIGGLAALVALNGAILRAGYRAMRAGSFYGTWIFCFWLGESVQMLSADVLTFWRVLPVYFWVLAMAVRNGYTR
jgi:O-antigen ligase